MDSSERDMFDLAKRSGDHLNHHNAGISVDRQQFDNPSMGLITTNTSIAISQGNQMGSSNSFPSLWNCENSLQTTMGTSNIVSAGKPVPLSSRLDMDWSSLESMSKGGMFLQTGSGILPPSLSHFPSNPTFIEPASRLSCFNGGSFSSMVNPFGTSESLSPYSNASKGVVGARMQKSDLTATQAFKGVDRESNNGSPTKNQRDKVSLQINDYREPDFNGSDQKESPDSANGSGNSSFKGLGSKKKRSHQDMELEQVQRGPELTAETTNAKQKLEQNNPTLATVKPNGKQSKDNSDAAKEDYIHMRARRGQATNSHSLAERVRREKISERMKYLQELVPGCSKVTGKAVMLDEIINYVQSLQRQVEFLSMKLATVNPRLDFNIEGLLSNDLQSRGGTSMIGFSPDMMHTQLHPSQQGLIQAGISGFVNHSDALRKGVLSQLTAMNVYKEPTPQTHDAWDNQLHSFVQMTFGANPHINTQESNDKPRDGFPL